MACTAGERWQWDCSSGNSEWEPSLRELGCRCPAACVVLLGAISALPDLRCLHWHLLATRIMFWKSYLLVPLPLSLCVGVTWLSVGTEGLGRSDPGP